MDRQEMPNPGGHPGAGGIACVRTADIGRTTDAPKSSTAPAAVEARLARERTLDRAECRQDRRRALGHLLAAVGVVLTRDHPVAGHAARIALGAGRRA